VASAAETNDIGITVTYLYVFAIAIWALWHRTNSKVTIYLRVILSLTCVRNP
jgi:hypothetical protein